MRVLWTVVNKDEGSFFASEVKRDSLHYSPLANFSRNVNSSTQWNPMFQLQYINCRNLFGPQASLLILFIYTYVYINVYIYIYIYIYCQHFNFYPSCAIDTFPFLTVVTGIKGTELWRKEFVNNKIASTVLSHPFKKVWNVQNNSSPFTHLPFTVCH